MNSMIILIIQILGFYIISSIGIYKYLIEMEDDKTILDDILLIIAFAYTPLIILYDEFRVRKAIYLRDKTVKQLTKYIEKVDKKILNETNDTKLAELKADRLRKATLLYYFTCYEGDNE